MKARNATAVLGFILALASGCGARTSEVTGGETHWLVACDEQQVCGGGLECICGRCTTSCSSDAVCLDFAAHAACLPSEGVAHAQGCDDAPRRICGEASDAKAETTAGESYRDAEVPPAVTLGEMDASSSSMNGNEVTASTAEGSSEGAPSASTQLGNDSEPPAPFDELPMPEGWDGLKLIDPYSDECVITETYDRNSEPPGTEGVGYLWFSCGGGPSVFAFCQSGGVARDMWSCSCSGQDRSANSTIQFKYGGLTEIDAARIVGALCVTELPTELAKEQETCTPRTPTLYPDSCLHATDCVRTVTMGDLVLEQTLESESSCYWGDGDVAQCTCTGLVPSRVGLFSVSVSPVGQSCDVATNLCDDGVDTGSVGAIECTLAPQNSILDELWCDTMYECTQPALVDGRAVAFADRQVPGICRRLNASDPWECDCGIDRTTLSAPDATTACQLGFQWCLELQPDDLREW